MFFINIILISLIVSCSRGQGDPASEVVAPNGDDTMNSPSRQAVVQHPVTVSVHAPQAMTTRPPSAPLKTRVVVVHNNMVPVPIECFQPPDSGTCSKDLARIYYDHETRTCKPFSYTGCGGNANRFQSIKNCYRICHPYRYKIRPKIARGKNNQAVKVRAVPAQRTMGGGGGYGDLSGAAMAQQQAAQASYNMQNQQAQQQAQMRSMQPQGGYGGNQGQITPLTQKHVIMTNQGPQVKNQVVGQAGQGNVGMMNQFQPQG